jgi:hypothetical protein
MRNVMQRIRRIEYDTQSGPKQPEPADVLDFAARIKAVANRRRTDYE